MAKPKSQAQLSMDEAYYGDQLGGIPEQHWCYRFYRHVYLKFDDAKFAEMYRQGGRYPVSPRLLMCICILQYMFGLSDRRAVDETIGSRYWRIALGIKPGYAGFHPTVLVKFRRRLLIAQKERLAFDVVLQEAREQGLLKGHQQVRIDATHLLANVALLSRVDMISETIRLVVTELFRCCPQLHEDFTFMRLYERYGEEVWLGKDATSEGRLIELARDGQTLLALCAGHEIKTEQLLVRVLEENYTFAAEGGEPIPKAQQDLAPDHMVSPHDPDVEVGKKDDFLWNGDKVHVTETVAPGETGFIVDVETTGPRVPDAKMLSELSERTKFVAPGTKTVFADAGYSSAANTKRAAALGLDLVSPARLNNTKGLFPATVFEFDFKNCVATCPGKCKSCCWYKTKTRLRIKFSPQHCSVCRLRAKCTTSKEARTLTLSLDFEQLCQDRERCADPAFANLYRQRAGIEATISELVRCCGLRRSRYRGSPKRRLHALLATTALNTRRLLRCLEDAERTLAQSNGTFLLIFAALRRPLPAPTGAILEAA